MDKFERIVMNCSHGICIISAEGKYIFANTTFLKLFGYTKTELFNMSAGGIVHESDIERLTEYRIARISGKPAPTEYEFTGITKTGDIKHIRCFASVLEWEGNKASQLFIIDISNDKELEHVMLQTVNENIQIGLWRVDSVGDLIYANQSFCDILENDFDHLKGSQFYSYFAKEVCFASILGKRCEELELTLGDGVKKWIKMSCTPTIGGCVGTIQDITKNKIYIPELIKLREEMKEERIR